MLAAFAAFLGSQQPAHSQAADAVKPGPDHPGKAIYDRTCAACHNNPEATRSPSFDTLRSMRFQAISYALTEGKMQVQGSTLSAADRATLIEYLAGKEATGDDWIASMMCPADQRVADLKSPASVTGFGFDAHNHRFLSKGQAGLATADFKNLELAWAIGFPKATTMRSQPAIVGSTLFLPVADASRLFAIALPEKAGDKPCIRWTYKSAAPLRSSAAYGELPGSKRKVVFFGDLAANIHMVDAATGAPIWQQAVGLYQFSLTTGTPVLYKDRVYVPISQYEITLGGDNKHECCKTHGAVTALDAATGKKIWTAHAMEEDRKSVV